jgi:hypothetical protein
MESAQLLLGLCRAVENLTNNGPLSERVFSQMIAKQVPYPRSMKMTKGSSFSMLIFI